MKRDIIGEQTVEERQIQIKYEIRQLVADEGWYAAADVILDLELSLRDALCDLERLRRGAA